MIRITKEADYAIMLLGSLAERPAGEVHTARQVAGWSFLPLPMVSKILRGLARGGILESHRGVSGGYSLERSPEALAYRRYDSELGEWTDLDWEQFTGQVCRWQSALLAEKLDKGDRVAIMATNSPDWAAFDMAAQGLGLVLVPL